MVLYSVRYLQIPSRYGSRTKRLEDGTLVSPPLEDLAPFLSREELKKIMFIPLLDEE